MNDISRNSADKKGEFTDKLKIGSKEYSYYSLAKAGKTFGDISKLPYCLKVLFENVLRLMDEGNKTPDEAMAFVEWLKKGKNPTEIAFRPSRVLMQDFTGVPAIVDLAAMRDALSDLGSDPMRINPLSPVDLVIDHSVMVDAYAHSKAFDHNVDLEFRRNAERYTFLKWGQKSFQNFRVVPPGTGICHQVNLEHLAKVVWHKQINGNEFLYPDTVVGTDSHTTMVNGLGVLGWGVGGIEAEAAMLGQPISMLIPEVIGVRLEGSMREGVTATDLVLFITELLRGKGVVEKFVEFFGPSLATLSLADRATIANMAPEYGATCGIFPIDAVTIDYLKLTGRSEELCDAVVAYSKTQGLWADPDSKATYTDVVSVDLNDVVPALAGPKRPQDRVALVDVAGVMVKTINTHDAQPNNSPTPQNNKSSRSIKNGDVVIAAITSCTNTSNPAVMVAAGLVARKARQLGLETKPWVKTSLAPGSQVVSEYLMASGLDKDLDAMGFQLVGYGCTTCIGNSGPLDEDIEAAIEDQKLSVAAVLSGNRNFEGRVHRLTRANFLASPPLVVAYALAGSMLIDISKDSIGTDKNGNPVTLKDIWPSNSEISEFLAKYVTSDIFVKRYKDVFSGTDQWQKVEVAGGEKYKWPSSSTYVQKPPYFEGMTMEPDAPSDVHKARTLLMLGDSITTDHISPAGSFSAASPAGAYLQDFQVRPADFNSYGSRRGNHQVMMRGTFGNIRIRNELVPKIEGGVTRHIPTQEQMSVYDAAMKYAEEKTPVIILAGKEYGTGSSRDWAAKGTRLLGVRAVVVESFERIHRSNLVGMGVLPAEFPKGVSRHTLKITGNETFDIIGIEDGLSPQQELQFVIHREKGSKEIIPIRCRIDTDTELKYYLNGGVLNYVLRQFAT